MATIDWLAMFPATKVVLLESGFLDHKPLLTYLTSISKVEKSLGVSSICGWRRKVVETQLSIRLYDLTCQPMMQVEGKINNC